MVPRKRDVFRRLFKRPGQVETPRDPELESNATRQPSEIVTASDPTNAGSGDQPGGNRPVSAVGGGVGPGDPLGGNRPVSAVVDGAGQSLWRRAFCSPELASERETLATIQVDINTWSPAEVASALGTMTEGILNRKRGRDWKISFRGDEIVLKDIGMKILRWVDNFKQIGDIVVQYDPVHAALPWAGFRIILKLCLDKQQTADEILLGLEKTAHIIGRCTVYEHLYLNQDSAASRNLENAMLQIYTAILKFMAKAIQRSRDSPFKAIFDTGKIAEYLGDIEELEKTVSRDAAVANAQSTSSDLGELRTLLDGLNTTTSRMAPQIDNIEERLEVSRRTEILEWISTIPYLDHHKRISEGRLGGTAEWLLRRKEYLNWVSSSASKLLLLRGIPGAGKTYIASKVIDSLLLTGEKLAYFYCNRAEENRREPESILNTLIQQLCQTECQAADKLLKPVVDIYQAREKAGQKSSRLSLGESQELLVQLTNLYPRTTICIDALDEIDDTDEIRMRLLRSLNKVIAKSKSLVKIFATTRMHPDIVRQFEIFPRIELQPDDNESDINKFVRTRVQSVLDEGLLLGGNVDGELKAEIQNALCERSRGMFQLAALQITFLCKMHTTNDVRKSLVTLPDTLSEAYNRIYDAVLAQKGSACQIALNAFRWIQCSYEPLRSETLLDAIMAEVSSSGEFSQAHGGTIQANDLLKLCQNLLILDEKLNVFRFAHLSVDEFLENKLPNVGSHTYVAEVCLSLLCTPHGWDKFDRSTRTKAGEYNTRHLLLYATVFWPWHVSICEGALEISEGFLSDSGGCYGEWFRYYGSAVETKSWSSDSFWEKSNSLQSSGRGDPIFSACVFGLNKTFRRMRCNWDIATLGQLLLIACKFGYLPIVELLIDGGADTSAADSREWTPLHWTADRGHEAVARLLIDGGADTSAADSRGWTPLHRAADRGHEAVARLLRDAGY